MLHEGFDSYFELNINYDFYRNIKIYNLLTLKEVVMKKKLLVIAAASVLASPVMAQSAFQGFYGQISTGYESNSLSNGNLTASDSTGSSNWNASSQTFGGAPLVLGIGYNYSVAPKWILGLGADYSVLPQTSSTYSATNPNEGTVSGNSTKVSNRYNIFITPGYEIDKDKLVYLKAGYSSMSITQNPPTTFTAIGGEAFPISGFGGQSKTVNGYVVGLGYKQIITGGIYAYAEGNYMSYGKPSFSNTQGNNTDPTTIKSNPSINSYQLLVGVGYRF